MHLAKLISSSTLRNAGLQSGASNPIILVIKLRLLLRSSSVHVTGEVWCPCDAIDGCPVVPSLATGALGTLTSSMITCGVDGNTGVTINSLFVGGKNIVYCTAYDTFTQKYQLYKAGTHTNSSKNLKYDFHSNSSYVFKKWSHIDITKKVIDCEPLVWFGNLTISVGY